MQSLFKGDTSRTRAGNESPLNKQIRKSNLCFLEIQIYSNYFFILLRLYIKLISKLSFSASGERSLFLAQQQGCASPAAVGWLERCGHWQLLAGLALTLCN